MLRLVSALLICVSAPALAQASDCAALAEAGKVSVPAAEQSQPPKTLPDRTLACPPGARLDFGGRLPRCLSPGTTLADGSPRAQCYASLPLGPVAPLPPQHRPTRTCPAGDLITIVRLEGANAGLSDVTLAVRGEGLRAETLSGGDKAPVAEQPATQGCFAHACRLVRLTVAAEAGDDGALTLTVPGGEPVVVPVPLVTRCPDPVARP